MSPSQYHGRALIEDSFFTEKLSFSVITSFSSFARRRERPWFSTQAVVSLFCSSICEMVFFASRHSITLLLEHGHWAALSLSMG